MVVYDDGSCGLHARRAKEGERQCSPHPRGLNMGLAHALSARNGPPPTWKTPSVGSLHGRPTGTMDPRQAPEAREPCTREAGASIGREQAPPWECQGRAALSFARRLYSSGSEGTPTASSTPSLG